MSFFFPNHHSSSSSSSSRMKLLPRRTHHFPHHHHHHHQHHHHRRSQYLEKLKKYYKWLLWLSLSLYLFFSTATSSSPSKPPLAPASSSSSPPLRIYVYDLPARYNRDWLSNPRCGSHLFAAEVAIHEALLAHGDRALDPADADLFFVPVYVSCNFSTPTGLPSLRHARPLLSSAVRLLSSRFPFWNLSRGRDHLFVASHDFAACFHPMEDVAVADGIPDFLRHSILLQTFGSRRPHPCQQAAHVVIPPYVSPDIALHLPPDPAAVPRDIWAFFRGKMEVHPKNISGRFYSKKVRTEILERYGGNPRFYLKRKRYAGYRAEIARSVFCLCPLGWAPWSPRLVEAVVLGCVPVVIADDIRLPFPEVVRWEEISLAVPERDVARLEAVLDHVAATNLSEIQRNLWDPAKRRALLFHRPMEEGDATWQAMRELRAMLGRSRRRRRPRGESGADTWRSCVRPVQYRKSKVMTRHNHNRPIYGPTCRSHSHLI
ncbi:probable glucuronosyltransferase Os03g0107900 [Ananas comosus]|uniref:Probable glucuronosyltransferase Os03g0107900 n=1 Tax=Ananas comosus TaxID=4615 RepID=A0A6P5FEI8_ANACO|nr:probable glucuronosyltransferase Os03g0107900 [Ananas comosus]